MKRLIGGILLTAVLAGVATPCSAAFMRCGMELPSPGERCGSCDADRSPIPDLRAGSCCRVEPGRERDGAPARIAAPAPRIFAPEPAAVSVAAAPAIVVSDLRSTHPAGAPEATGPPPRPTGSTILRL